MEASPTTVELQKRVTSRQQTDVAAHPRLTRL